MSSSSHYGIPSASFVPSSLSVQCVCGGVTNAMDLGQGSSPVVTLPEAGV